MSDEGPIGSGERGYWALRPDGAPDPEDDPCEAMLLAHGRMLDQINQRTAAGEFTVLVSWRAPAGDPRTAANRASALADLIAREDACLTAAGCHDAPAGQITAVATLSSLDGFFPAKRLAEQITKRLQGHWGYGLGQARVDPPSPDAVDAWRSTRAPA